MSEEIELRWYHIQDGDCQHSSAVQAPSAKEAEDIWEEGLNPYGLEVTGHPWLDPSGTREISEEEALTYIFAWPWE